MSDALFFLSSLGVFNGILLCIYLLVFSKHKNLNTYLLGALILALTIRIGKSVILYFNPYIHKGVLQFGLSACLFIGPLLYFYLKSISHNIKTLPSSWKNSLVILFITILILGAIRPYHIYPEFWNEYVVKSIYLIWFLGVLAASYIIAPTLLKFFNSHQKVTSIDKWMSIIYLGNMLIAAAFFLAIFGNSMAYYISGPLVFSLFLYLLVFGFFYERQFKFSPLVHEVKYQNKKIDTNTAAELITKLNDLISHKKIYKDKNLKLNDVAHKLEISSHHLSQLLNDNLGKSFRTYINEKRVDAACDLLGHNELLSLEGIGYEVGFKSKSTFFTTFKKIKTVTPAQYKEGKLIKKD